MLELWQLLQSPVVMVEGITCVSGHLLNWTLAGKAMAVVV